MQLSFKDHPGTTTFGVFACFMYLLCITIALAGGSFKVVAFKLYECNYLLHNRTYWRACHLSEPAVSGTPSTDEKVRIQLMRES